MSQILVSLMILIPVLNLSACDRNARVLSISKSNTATDKSLTDMDPAGPGVTSDYNSSYRGNQILQGGDDTGGAAVTFPAGTLPNNAQISMTPAGSLAIPGIATGLGVDPALAPASSAVKIGSNPAQNPSNPMVLSIPVGGSTGLINDHSRLIIIYEAFDAATKGYVTGIMPRSEFEFAGGKITAKVSRFGIYQAAYTKELVTKPIKKDGAIKDIAPAVDITRPSLTISSSVAAATNAGSFEITFTFSEPVTGFEVSDITVANAALSALTAVSSGSAGEAAVYTATVTPTTEGSVTVQVAFNKASDLAGNGNDSDSSGFSRIYDVTPPTIGVWSAGSATDSSLTLNWTTAGDTFTAGSDLQYFVCQSPSLASITSASDCESGSQIINYTPSTYTVTLTGLSASLTYYFNIIVKDQAGNRAVYGTTSSSTLADATPPVPGSSGSITVPAPSITATGLSLNWAAASDTETPQASLEYYVCSGPALTDIDTPTECLSRTQEMNWTTAVTSYAITGKAPTTTLSYNVLVRDSLTNQAAYAGVTASTTADIMSPTAGAITATSATETTVTLTWSAGSDNVTTATSLQYQVCAHTNSSSIDSVSECDTHAVMVYTANTLTYTATSLAPSQTYYFRVVVKDAVGLTALYGQASQATTADVTAPTIGAFSAATSPTDSSFTLNWTTSTDNVTASGNLQYLVCNGVGPTSIDTVANCELNGISGGYSTSRTINQAGKTPSTAYYYNVVVKDEANQKSIYPGYSHTTSSDATDPAAGTFSASTAITDTGFTLNWSAGVDAGTAPSALQYRVCTAGSLAAIDTVPECESATQVMAYSLNTLSFAITGKQASNTYHYNVIVKDGVGRKAIYDGKSQATAADATPPTIGAFSASSTVGATSLTLNWTAGSDAVTSAASLEYLVCQHNSNPLLIDTDTECEGASIQGYTANITSFLVTGLSPSQTYYFNIVVKDQANLKAIYAAKTQATTADVTAPTVGAFSAATGVTDSGFTINWSTASDNVTPTAGLSYRVCKAASTATISSVSGCNTNAVTVFTAASLSYTATGLPPSQTHYYNVVVKDATGNQSIYPGISIATGADATGPAIGSFSPFTNVGLDGVTLNWTQSTDNGTSQSSLQYYVCASITQSDVSTISGCEGATQVMNWTTATTTVTATSLIPNTRYYFNVLVKDSVSNKSIYAGSSLSPRAVTVTTDNDRSSSVRHSFYDTLNSKHWRFYINGGFIVYEYSTDGISWTAGGSIAATVSKFTVHYKAVSAAGYAFVVSEEGDNITLRRGLLASSSLSFGSTVAVFSSNAGTTYKNPAVTTDDSNLWIAASYFNGSVWQIMAKESSVPPDGALSNGSWNTAHAVGTVASTAHDLALVPNGLEKVFLASQVGGALSGFLYNSGWTELTSGGTDAWFPIGSAPGLNGSVNVMTVHGNAVYVGGLFTDAGGNPAADNLAKWTGSAWEAVGGGLNGAVKAIAVAGSKLYIGGDFTDAGGNTSADRIAAWDGVSWQALGSGANASVNAIGVTSSALYVGGAFTNAGSVGSTSYLAKWNGTAWSAVGVVNASVNDIVVASDTAVYVAGAFTSVSSDANKARIVKWNGSSWEALNTGLSSTVYDLLLVGSDLYVGGAFIDAGGNTAADRIATWNGASWSAVGSGIGSGVVKSLSYVSSTSIYAAGTFSGGLAKFNGTNWSAVPGGSTGITTLASDGTNLYVGGDFQDLNTSSTLDGIAKYNGSSWAPVGGGGFNGEIRAAAVMGSSLYVGGDFTDAGGNTSADYLAKFDGTTWSPVLDTSLNGVNGPVYSLAVDGSTLYVGGSFTQIGANVFDRIAKYSGAVWYSLGSAFTSSTVVALAASSGTLYAADGVAFKSFNGSTWASLLSLSGVRTLAIGASASEVYVGGSFLDAGGNANADNIFKWNGSTVVPLASGLTGAVNAVAYYSASTIYAGGAFTNAGGNTSANYLAKFNSTTTTWSNVGGGFTSTVGNVVNSLTLSGQLLYVGGKFKVGGSENFAIWDGGPGLAWSGLGTGVGNEVIAVGVGTNITAVGSGLINQSRTAAANNVGRYSLAVDDSSNPSLLYTTRPTGALTVRSYAGSWGTALALDAAGASRPVLSATTGTGLAAFWLQGSSLVYRLFNGSTWGSTVTFVSGIGPRAPACDLSAGGGAILCMVTSDATTGYYLSTWKMTP